MKLIAIAIACLLTVASIGNASESKDAIRAKCKNEWPTDYGMQKYCIDKQMESVKQFNSYQDRWPEGSEERNILIRCFGKWAGDDGSKADYSMTVYCFDQQLEAYQSLQE